MDSYEVNTYKQLPQEESALRRRNRHTLPAEAAHEAVEMTPDFDEMPAEPAAEETFADETIADEPVNDEPVFPEGCCKACGAEMPDEFQYCEKCGADREGVKPRFCPKCDNLLSKKAHFCPKCGKKVSLLPALRKPDMTPVKNFVTDKKNLKWLIVAAVALVLVIALIAVLGSLGRPKNFNQLFGDIAAKKYITIAEDGTWMELDTNPSNKEDYFDMESYNMISTINERLGFDGYLFKEMGSTRSVDGRQSAECENYSVTWSYHPDKGLEAIYRMK